MKLIELDLFYAQGFQRPFASGPQLLGPSCGDPATGRPGHSTFGGNDHLLPIPRVAPQRPSDQSLVMSDLPVIGAVHVGSIDEGDSGIERRMYDPDSLLFRRSFLDGEVHATVADRGHLGCVAPEFAAGNHCSPSAVDRKRSSSSRTS